MFFMSFRDFWWQAFRHCVKPTLLVIELWGLGDLVIASPFMQAASRKYDVTLLAKPYAIDLQERFWPGVRVVPFHAPWTAFRRKYRFLSWPWREIIRLRHLAREDFDLGLSARWDPRDHFLLKALRVRSRYGFPRLRSKVFLTDSLERPELDSHRYENWRTAGRALGLELPERDHIELMGQPKPDGNVLVHSGAGQSVRVWPLERFAAIVARLRREGRTVIVACDPDQRDWWLKTGETQVATPHDVSDLLRLVDTSRVFLGNDSGPSHLAAYCGIPTFTIFGPQITEWFAPLNPKGQCFEGKPCPYKPCFDYCRYPAPFCLRDITAEDIWEKFEPFVKRN